jgi:hypothetical protein
MAMGPKMMHNVMEKLKWCGLFNIQGAIDGTHVSISKPIIIFPKDYYHHKLGDIPLLFKLAIVVDCNKNFFDVFIRLLGSVNDSWMLHRFRLYKRVQFLGLFN